MWQRLRSTTSERQGFWLGGAFRTCFSDLLEATLESRRADREVEYDNAARHATSAHHDPGVAIVLVGLEIRQRLLDVDGHDARGTGHRRHRRQRRGDVARTGGRRGSAARSLASQWRYRHPAESVEVAKAGEQEGRIPRGLQ